MGQVLILTCAWPAVLCGASEQEREKERERVDRRGIQDKQNRAFEQWKKDQVSRNGLCLHPFYALELE